MHGLDARGDAGSYAEKELSKKITSVRLDEG
jgi:hypothetical protein